MKKAQCIQTSVQITNMQLYMEIFCRCMFVICTEVWTICYYYTLDVWSGISTVLAAKLVGGIRMPCTTPARLETAFLKPESWLQTTFRPYTYQLTIWASSVEFLTISTISVLSSLFIPSRPSFSVYVLLEQEPVQDFKMHPTSSSSSINGGSGSMSTVVADTATVYMARAQD
jgi:hypothetical protein